MEEGGEQKKEPEKVCPDRHKWSIAVTAATALSMWICVIGYGAHYNVQLSADFDSQVVSLTAACALQSVFGIFTTIALVETIIMIISWVGICCKAKKDFYRLNIVSHCASLIGIFIGCIIFGIKKQEEIYWFFWFAVIASFLCVGNLTIWFPSQFMRRRDKIMQVKLDAATPAM